MVICLCKKCKKKKEETIFEKNKETKKMKFNGVREDSDIELAESLLDPVQQAREKVQQENDLESIR